jgi:hypothetical protein
MIIEEFLIGKEARSKHPITALNPTENFIISEIRVEFRAFEDGKYGHCISVRGDNTCYFGRDYWELV